MQLDDLLKVTFDGEVWIQNQVCTLPNGRRHRHKENRKQKLARNFRTGTSRKSSSDCRSWPEARNPLVLLGILFLPETKSFRVSGSWSCLLLTSFCFAER